MNLIQALVLGLLQGATEFLPVSSSGHLVLVPWLLGWSAPPLLYDIVVHLGTLLAVVVHFGQDIVAVLRGLLVLVRTRRAESVDARLAWHLILSAIPGAILGYFLEDLFERLFSAPLTVSLLLCVTAALLLISEHLGRRERDVDSIRPLDALTMGLAQGLAIAPGISRSGATMAAGLLRGLDRTSAARFSFLMSVPIILGAGAYQMLKLFQGGSLPASAGLLLAGFAAAAISGYVAIRWMLNLIRTHSLRPFAYYCLAAAALGIVLSLAP